jgi:signal transduction histidine kinase
MKARSRYIIILGVVFGYILLQFTWWEILLVKQTGKIINEEQKLTELTSTDRKQLQKDIEALHQRKKMQIIMIVGEGTVFLLLLLYGIGKIRQAMDKESLLNRQQSNFFLSITHELKTPIAATKLQLQTLQRQKLDASTQAELIANALAETDRLNLLIENVLLASNFDNGQPGFNMEKCDLSEEVNAIARRYYKKEIDSAELKITTAPGSFAAVDRHAFPSVLTNLISNAIKYSGQNRQIEVNVFKKNDKVTIAVKDNGCGISDADKENIFMRFYRAGNEETRSSKGTGLGLFIVKYILDKHNAIVRVKDNLPQGSI